MTNHIVFPEITIPFVVQFEGAVIESSDIGDTYILEDEDGNELVGVLVSQEIVFDATPNDIRFGKVAATETGVTKGTKVIPSYNTTEGICVVLPDRPLSIRVNDYDYTKLQAIVCQYNTSLSDSVSAEQVAIEGNIYNVQSTIVVSAVSTNDTEGTIEFGIKNTYGKPCLIRYFIYKEIY